MRQNISPSATPADITAAIRLLRVERRTLVETYGAEKLQAMTVAALAAVARQWLEVGSADQRRLLGELQPSYDETWPSLDALCASMTEDALWKLIDSEQMRGVLGPDVIGHVIAGNTPLLAWTSAARALLVGSASLLKLPSGDAQIWSRSLFQSLRRQSPELARLVTPLTWSSTESLCTSALCDGTDRVVAYGSDETMRLLRDRLPPGKLLEYGHRVSCAVVAQGADFPQAAAGIAWDTWVYDQSGCLSPQCVLVEGDWDDGLRFGGHLAAALARLPAKTWTANQAARVQEQRLLARMQAGILLSEGEDWAWTVGVAPGPNLRVNDAPMFIYVVPGDFLGMIQALSLWADYLQGVCLCAGIESQRRSWTHHLQSLGITHIVGPAELQRPALSWRENGRDVLRSLLPALSGNALTYRH